MKKCPVCLTEFDGESCGYCGYDFPLYLDKSAYEQDLKAHYSRAAEKVFSDANGLYQSKQYNDALIKYSLAEKMGKAEASNCKGKCAYQLAGILYKNYKFVDAIQLYNLAKVFPIEEAKDCNYQMGKCYLSMKQYDKALEFFKLAKYEMNTHAFFYLGVMFYEGWGVTKDIKTAVDLLQEARGFGMLDAANKLGEILYNENIEKEEMFRIFYDLNSKDRENIFLNAKYILGQCFDFGLGTEIDKSKAIETYTKLSDLAVDFRKYSEKERLIIAKAKRRLGNALIERASQGDKKKGLEYLQQAADMGDEQAFKLLKDN